MKMLATVLAAIVAAVSIVPASAPLSLTPIGTHEDRALSRPEDPRIAEINAYNAAQPAHLRGQSAGGATRRRRRPRAARAAASGAA